MLSMPGKPPKKVRFKKEAEGHYTLVFISSFKDEVEFEKAIEEDIIPCLGEHDSIGDRSWEAKTLTLMTDDLEAFQHELLFQSYIVKRGCPCE